MPHSEATLTTTETYPKYLERGVATPCMSFTVSPYMELDGIFTSLIVSVLLEDRSFKEVFVPCLKVFTVMRKTIAPKTIANMWLVEVPFLFNLSLLPLEIFDALFGIEALVDSFDAKGLDRSILKGLNFFSFEGVVKTYNIYGVSAP